MKSQKKKSMVFFKANFGGSAETMDAFSLYCLPERREVVIQGPADTCIPSQEAVCMIPRACSLYLTQCLTCSLF